MDGVSFRVHKGEIMGFLGPNGAGKTTTMRILTCYLPPTDGTARVAGYDVFEQPLEVKRRVGYTPETPPLYPDMDVQTFLDFCAKIKGVPAASRKTKIADAIEKTRTGDVRTTLIGRLSKGYRQRVGLAQAILHSAPVVDGLAGLGVAAHLRCRADDVESVTANEMVIIVAGIAAALGAAALLTPALTVTLVAAAGLIALEMRLAVAPAHTPAG